MNRDELHLCMGDNGQYSVHVQVYIHITVWDSLDFVCEIHVT